MGALATAPASRSPGGAAATMADANAQAAAHSSAVAAADAGADLLVKATRIDPTAAAALMRKALDVEARVQSICTDARAEADAGACDERLRVLMRAPDRHVSVPLAL